MGGPAVDLLKSSRRGFLKYTGLSALGAFITACLSSNAPAGGGAASPATGGAGGGISSPAATINWKIQSGLARNNIFQGSVTGLGQEAGEKSSGRLKIETLLGNS